VLWAVPTVVRFAFFNRISLDPDLMGEYQKVWGKIVIHWIFCQPFDYAILEISTTDSAVKDPASWDQPDGLASCFGASVDQLAAIAWSCSGRHGLGRYSSV
jgi:hypothetical protein